MELNSGGKYLLKLVKSFFPMKSADQELLATIIANGSIYQIESVISRGANPNAQDYRIASTQAIKALRHYIMLLIGGSKTKTEKTWSS